ncbi:hypothetical protein LXL04_027300 [Taraxacum kok-saghyz]
MGLYPIPQTSYAGPHCHTLRLVGTGVERRGRRRAGTRQRRKMAWHTAPVQRSVEGRWIFNAEERGVEEKKTELDNKLMEMRSTIGSMREEQRALELTIDEIKHQDSKITDLKSDLHSSPPKIWSVSSDDPSTRELNLTKKATSTINPSVQDQNPSVDHEEKVKIKMKNATVDVKETRENGGGLSLKGRRSFIDDLVLTNATQTKNVTWKCVGELLRLCGTGPFGVEEADVEPFPRRGTKTNTAPGGFGVGGRGNANASTRRGFLIFALRFVEPSIIAAIGTGTIPAFAMVEEASLGVSNSISAELQHEIDKNNRSS